MQGSCSLISAVCGWKIFFSCLCNLRASISSSWSFTFLVSCSTFSFTSYIWFKRKVNWMCWGIYFKVSLVSVSGNLDSKPTSSLTIHSQYSWPTFLSSGCSGNNGLRTPWATCSTTCGGIRSTGEEESKELLYFLGGLSFGLAPKCSHSFSWLLI